MSCLNLFKEMYKGLQLDWSNAVLGGVVGLILVLVYGWIRKPKIKFGKFIKVKVNFGILYKVEIKIYGHINPGLSVLNIKLADQNISAKWDECPNPLEKDKLGEFVPELVPQTFYLNTFSGKTYYVPIIHEDDSKNLTIFSGWWFGKELGYSAPSLSDHSKIQLEFLSQNANKKSKYYVVENIIRETI